LPVVDLVKAVALPRRAGRLFPAGEHRGPIACAYDRAGR
jgi:hypothetical protein